MSYNVPSNGASNLEFLAYDTLQTLLSEPLSGQSYMPQPGASNLEWIFYNILLNIGGGGGGGGIQSVTGPLVNNQTPFNPVVGLYGGSNYTLLLMKGRPIDNFNELRAAYQFARSLDTLSATNRYAIIVPPCVISTPFAVDIPFVDVISLTGKADVFFQDGFFVDTDNVIIKGVTTGNLPFTILGDYENNIYNTCFGGDNSFNSNPFTSGTFINCEAGNDSYGFQTNCNGGFYNCKGGGYCFGAEGEANGFFVNCSALIASFGGGGGIATGGFKNCDAGNNSFGSTLTSGTFENCTAGNGSFGEITGRLFFCRLTSGSFPTVSPGGITRYCLNGDNSPDNQG